MSYPVHTGSFLWMDGEVRRRVLYKTDKNRMTRKKGIIM